MGRKYKCKYCNKLIAVKDGMCSDCEEKLMLVKKLLRMVNNAAGKRERDRDKL